MELDGFPHCVGQAAALDRDLTARGTGSSADGWERVLRAIGSRRSPAMAAAEQGGAP